MEQATPSKFILKRFLHDLSVARKLVPFLGNLKHLIAISIILGLLASFVETVTVGVVVLFVFTSLSDSIQMPQSGLAADFFSFVKGVTGDDLLLICGVILSAILLKSVIRGAYNLLSAYISNTVHHRVRTALFSKYMSLYYKDLSKKDFGAMANTLQVESWYVPEVIKALSGALISLCALSVYLLIITLFSWPMTLIIIVLGILMKVVMMGMKEPMRRLGFETTDIHEKMALRMYTRMQGLKTIRAHGMEQGEIDAFSRLSERVSKAFTHIAVVDTYLKPVYDLSILLIIASLIWASYSLGNPASLTATIIAMLYRLQPYFYGLEGALLTLMKSEGPLQAVLRQLEGGDIRQDKAGDVSVPKDWKSIRFDHVGFAYDHEDILNGISFDLSRGKVLAVTGASGAGKSTLINLFLKLTTPASGMIYLDNHPFADINRQEWQGSIAAAGQDFQLLDGTLRENLTLGRDIPDDVLDKALQMAEIKDVTDKLEDGLDTRIGERGIRLSGGQRQRIVLARALAFQPDLLILDEATSEVSMPVEQKIYENIKDAYPDLSIVLITHRNLPENFVDQVVSL